MAKKNITDVVSLFVDELTPFSSDERQRAFQATMTLLGEPVPKFEKFTADEKEEIGEETGHLTPKARVWIHQNSLTTEQLQQIFHMEDSGAEVIASEIPGKNNREKVRNVYVLVGIAQLLSNGETKFDDKSAREHCERYGVYDSTNHAKYMKGGNEFTGSRAKGWTLTAPGLKHGAQLISAMTH